MCGITGIWSRELDAQRIEADARSAIARLHHRGPDDEGIWTDGSGLVLGFRRLAIIDLTELGHQPMRSPDGRFVMVFNGEIYNYAEIKQRLAALGHTFSGTGDSEAILHAFAEWGSDAVKQFIGMFAIALWDTRDRKLELFRDRIGVKPLHWCWDGKTLCFASELKALRDYTHWTPEVDRQALGEFLQYGYIAGDRTIYQGVHKLKPGHRLTLAEGREPEITEYWSVLGALHAPLRGSEHDLEAELEALLIDAFRYRMVADVPIGIFLSGGIDSSLVTAILSRHFNQDIRTFTIGFSENSHDESPWAKRVAEHCGSQHTEYILGVDEALQIARSWGSLFDEPFGDSSGIPTLLVSRLASREVKVVLSADGGDEVFSGYNVYENVLERATLLGRIPPPMRSTLSALASLSSPALRSSGTQRTAGPAALTTRLHNLSLMLRNPSPGRILDMNLSQWQPEDIRRLIGGYECPRVDADSYHGDPALQISLWDFVHYLPEDILTKVDRTTMAASIEGREPLLDHRICEFGFSLPANLRRGPLGPKHLLRKILYRYVPRELVDRPKQGFAIPLRQWLRTELKELVMDHLSESRIRRAGIMDASEVARCVTAFSRGDAAAATPLWYLLAFEMWREAWC